MLTHQKLTQKMNYSCKKLKELRCPNFGPKILFVSKLFSGFGFRARILLRGGPVFSVSNFGISEFLHYSKDGTFRLLVVFVRILAYSDFSESEEVLDSENLHSFWCSLFVFVGCI